MTGKIKKTLSLILSVVFILSSFSVLSLADEKPQVNIGDSIYAGTYPQSRAYDPNLKSALERDSNGWTSYSYYIGNGIDSYESSGLMYYCDFDYQGAKYRAVRINDYRPTSTVIPSSIGSSNQFTNGYATGNTYFFKYEPIEWTVIDIISSGGHTYLKLMSKYLLDAQAFNDKLYTDGARFYSDAAHKYAANDYEYSTLRTWLNGRFLQTASIGKVVSPKIATSYSPLVSDDLVTVFSLNDAVNSNYGFDGSITLNDEARRAKGTDYAKCQGLSVSTVKEYAGNSFWRLLTAGNADYTAYDVSASGIVDNNSDVRHTDAGIRPVIYYDYDYNGPVIPDPPVYDLETNATLVYNKSAVVKYGQQVRASVSVVNPLESHLYLRIYQDGTLVASGGAGQTAVYFTSPKLHEGTKLRYQITDVYGNIAHDAEGHLVQSDEVVITVINTRWTRFLDFCRRALAFFGIITSDTVVSI